MIQTLPVVLALLGWAAVGQPRGPESPQSAQNDAQGSDTQIDDAQVDVDASVRELRQLVERLMTRVRVLEQRVRHLEGVLAAEGDIADRPPAFIRPIGRFYVDQHGIILDANGHAMGIWGVNGPDTVPNTPLPSVDQR